MNEYRFYLYHKDVGAYTRIADPVGWEGLGKTRKRFGMDNTVLGLRWHGIFFEYNVKLDFIKNGKAFVQNFYEKYKIEQEILLRVDKRAESRKFELEYEGRLNLTTYKAKTTSVSCNIENTGFLQKVKNRADIKVDVGSLASQGGTALTAFTTEFQDVIMHSKSVQELYKGSISGRTYWTATTVYGISEDVMYGGKKWRSLQTGNLNNVPAENAWWTEIAEFQYEVPGGQYFQYDFVNDVTEIDTKFDYPTDANPDKPFENFQLIRAGSYTFAQRLWINMKGAFTSPTQLKFYLQKNDEAPVPFTENFTCVNASDTDNKFLLRTINQTFNLTKGDKVRWYGKNEGVNTMYLSIEPDNTLINAASPCFTFDGSSTCTVTGNTNTPPTSAKMMMIHEFWTRIIQSITDRSDKKVFYSDYYGRTDLGYAVDGEGSLRGIANGFLLRGIDKPLYGTMKGILDTCLALDGVGIGIEKVNGYQRVRVEPLTYWYQAKRMMRLTNVLDIEKMAAGDLYYNSINGGNDKWKNIRASNLDEFNAKREWTIPVTQVKKSLELKCPYITSGYTIEYARRFSEVSKDSDVDNDNFVVQLTRNGLGGFVPERSEAFTSVTNINDPGTSYNLKLSPARSIRNNGMFIRSFLEPYKDQYIKYSFGEANQAMVTQLTGEANPIAENGDILISDLQAPLFLAEIYTFRVKCTKAQIAALDNVDPTSQTNAWGYVEFSSTARDFKRGYLLEARADADSDMMIMELLKANI